MKETCRTCAHWARNGNGRGDCRKLSGTFSIDGLKMRKVEIYPDINITGIESYPICAHDGAGFMYETLETFGCVHHVEGADSLNNPIVVEVKQEGAMYFTSVVKGLGKSGIIEGSRIKEAIEATDFERKGFEAGRMHRELVDLKFTAKESEANVKLEELKSYAKTEAELKIDLKNTSDKVYVTKTNDGNEVRRWVSGRSTTIPKTGKELKRTRVVTFDQTDANGIVFVEKSVDVSVLNKLVADGKIAEYKLTNKYLDVWFI